MVQRAQGTYRAGHIELDGPVDWEEGMRVSVESERDRLGMVEADWPTDAEGIEKLVQEMKALKPLIATPQELAELQAAWKRAKEASIDLLKKEWGI
jgi:hypothetical protein